ncbi:DUF2182 domain-containing protein [Nitrospira sp. Kam-Ns4a]
MAAEERNPQGAKAVWTGWLAREHLGVTLGLLALLALAWLDVLRRAGVFTSAGIAQALGMPQAAPWGPADAAMTAAMWLVMMVAMMLPAAVPMLLLFATITRQRAGCGRPEGPTGLFLAGYLALWGGFSLVATAAQGTLHALVLLSPEAALRSPLLGGGILLAAGLYQLTPLKQACLAHCQAPLQFLVRHWRDGPRGAWLMGLHHGGYCVGCCWALMALLFVGGVMNLAWIAVLSAVVLVERVVARGPALSRVAGFALILWGLWLVREGAGG